MARDWWNVLGVLAICCAAGVGIGHAEESGLSATTNGLEYRTGDGNVSVVLGGRLHLDAASIDDGAGAQDDTEVRRARLELAVKLFDDWQIRVDREFANGGGWRNVWLRYSINDQLNVKAGNFIAPYSMEDLGSSNDTLFMERSLAHALAPGFGLGGGITYEGKHIGLSGAYMDDAIDAEDNIQVDKGRGVTLRATWSPLESRKQTLHLGLGLEHRDFGGGDIRRISSAPEASLADTVVRTGAIANADTSRGINIEGGYALGPILIQAQYLTSELQRTVGADLQFDGYYAQIGWLLTGERHRYVDGAGVFSAPEPRGKWGAVELAARVSSLDLSDAAVGGQADDVTAGVNWYLGRNVRVMANYVHAEVDGVTPAQDRDVDVAEARFQVSF